MKVPLPPSHFLAEKVPLPLHTLKFFELPPPPPPPIVPFIVHATELHLATIVHCSCTSRIHILCRRRRLVSSIHRRYLPVTRKKPTLSPSLSLPIIIVTHGSSQTHRTRLPHPTQTRHIIHTLSSKCVGMHPVKHQLSSCPPSN
ncbi:hypothetical protein P152DRAFT_195966 [Eremomyces bilateralis CBS 781.70]|uniref:Uncharacterized protein n=1 Tax=Eremomyces bilateralis CBS 781.70 TaxID=1392243 RepID=A0A6G1GCD3_9PEZI|nr:uncharacterized protein P152DRAFT_195966 [Eremomyces bilateralis CBS 781.70]KAF1815758.1 hypothetical protein P152DRAFT_195966 [Eremomyces bilateralis CBS 781.70]